MKHETAAIRGIPSEVLVGEPDGLSRSSAGNFDHMQTVSRARIEGLIATLSSKKSGEVGTRHAAAHQRPQTVLVMLHTSREPIECGRVRSRTAPFSHPTDRALQEKPGHIRAPLGSYNCPYPDHDEPRAREPRQHLWIHVLSDQTAHDDADRGGHHQGRRGAEEDGELRVVTVGGVEEGGKLGLVAKLGQEDRREDGQKESALRHSDDFLLCYQAKAASRLIAQTGCGPTDPNDRGTKIDPEQLKHTRVRGLQVTTQFGALQIDTKTEVELCIPSASQ